MFYLTLLIFFQWQGNHGGYCKLMGTIREHTLCSSCEEPFQLGVTMVMSFYVAAAATLYLEGGKGSVGYPREPQAEFVEKGLRADEGKPTRSLLFNLT